VSQQDPEELAEELEREVEVLENRSEELHEQTDEVRQDWERKRNDRSVPGATPPEKQGAEPEAEFPSKAESLEDEDGD
jgi:hypothetical protein